MPRDLTMLARDAVPMVVDEAVDSDRGDPTGEDWPELEPDRPPVSVPDIDPAHIPDRHRAWLLDCARRMQVPVDAFLAVDICANGALVGRFRSILVAGGHAVYPCLSGGLVMASGERKTDVIKTALAPLYAVDKLDAEKHAATSADAIAAHTAATQRLEGIKTQFKKPKKGESVDALKTEYAQQLALQKILASDLHPTRRVVGSATTQKLVDLMEHSGKRGMMMSVDELASVLRRLDSGETFHDRGFYLQATTGAGIYFEDTVGRGPKRVEGTFLSVYGGIQPGVFARYVRDAAGGECADGLLQRLAILIYRPCDARPKSLSVDRPDARAYALVETRALSIAEWSPVAEPLAMSHDARRMFGERHDELEAERCQVATSCSAFASLLGKWPSIIARVALIVDSIDREDELAGSEISVEAMVKAIGIGDHFLLHQRALYGEYLDPARNIADKIVSRIRSGTLADRGTLRDLKRSLGTIDDDDLRRGIDELTRRHWLRVERGVDGGRPSYVIRLHPDLVADPMAGSR